MLKASAEITKRCNEHVIMSSIHETNKRDCQVVACAATTEENASFFI